MAIKTQQGGVDFEKAPEGMHIGRCFKVVDCGTHFDEKFKKMKHLVSVFFELPNVLMTEGDAAGKPFIISKRYTLSHDERAILRLDLESWYGKKFDTDALDSAGGFDLSKSYKDKGIVGRPCFLNVVHSRDGKYANIMSINPLPKEVTCPPQINPSFVFELDPFDEDKFAKLSDKMQEWIRTCAELNPKEERDAGRVPGSPPPSQGSADDFADDIPF